MARHVGKHHGYYGTPTYKSWYCMKYRCGKVGTPWEQISYCEEWADFRNFLRDMGERPKGTSLDRIDVNGNYCKENCRWADVITQCNNRTNNRKVFYKGEWIGITQLARQLKLCRSSICQRIDKYGMTLEEAILYIQNHHRVREVKEIGRKKDVQ